MSLDCIRGLGAPRPACGERSDRIIDAIRVRGAIRAFECGVRAPHPNPLPAKGRGEGAYFRCGYTSPNLIKPQQVISSYLNKKRQRICATAVPSKLRAYFIAHLSWKRSWSSLTMVATVLSESSPLSSLTTSCR